MIIYKITNKINGKCYIGQTVQRMNSRFSRHKHNAFIKKEKTPLYNAMRKYGFTNFKIEEINGANNISELNYKEFITIHKEDSLIPNGYNILYGGNNRNLPNSVKVKISNTLKKVYDKDRLRRMTENSLKVNRKSVCVENIETGEVKIYESVKATQEIGSHKHINDILTGKRPYKLFKKKYWIWYESDKNYKEKR